MPLEDNIAAFHSMKKKVDASQSMIKDSWGFDEWGLANYDLYFEETLGHSLLTEVEHLQREFGDVRAANVMGGLTILRQLPISEGYAVRLTDKRPSYQKDDDAHRHLHVIIGDILSKKTWMQIPKNLQLIMSLPLGADISIPELPFFYYQLGSRMINTLSVGGIALVQMPPKTSIWMDEYIKQIPPSESLQLHYLPMLKKIKSPCSALLIRKTAENATLPNIERTMSKV
jgi:hypothetical protein